MLRRAVLDVGWAPLPQRLGTSRVHSKWSLASVRWLAADANSADDNSAQGKQAGKHGLNFKPPASPAEVTEGFAHISAAILKPFMHTTSPLRPALEAARSSTNAVLTAANAPVRLQFAAAAEEKKEGEREHLSTWSGKSPVSHESIGTYVDTILNYPGDVVNITWLPDVIERQIYIVVVKMVLQMLHFACGIIDRRAIFGQTLYMAQRRSRHKLDRADVSLTNEMVSRLVDQVAMPTGESAIISESVDRIVYHNVIRFALRLIIDLVSSMQVKLFGLRITLRVEPDYENAATRQDRPAFDMAEFEAACEPLICELLSDDQINIAILPDALEEQLYRNVLRLLANVCACVADSSEIDIGGIRINPDIA